MNLEALYKEHVAHSHLKALEIVFQAGVEHALERANLSMHDVTSAVIEERDLLKTRFQELEDKYVALLTKVAEQTAPSTGSAEDAQKAADQALHMGETLMPSTEAAPVE